MLCRVLRVSRSGYYDWLKRMAGPPGTRAAQNQVLAAEIEAIHRDFAYYGSPRVHRALLARGHHVGRHRAARLMRTRGIRARRGRIKARPRSAPPARRPEVTDKVSRNFATPGADLLWLTDITQIRTGQGWLYAAVILDAFNREVVSWAVDGLDTPRTVMQALREALLIRRPQHGCVIHSDRGYQFTSREWLDLAAGSGLEVSIGERKSCYDNAMMETWFASFKTEEIYPNGTPFTKAEARTRLFNYIWTYNTRRIHSSLGYVAPRTYTAQSSICP
jgi:putative transposase